MLNFRTLTTLVLVTITVCAATHRPKVYEDEVEYNRNENIRTVRNSESTYRTIHQPPVFNFEAAKQQDYLKFRYAEQQKANTVTMVNGMAKSQKFRQPQQILYKTITGNQKEHDWQPFDPKVPNLDLRNLQRLLQHKISKDLKLQKPNLLKVNVGSKNIIPQAPRTNRLNFTIATNDDLSAQGSETVEQKVNLKRSDSLNEYDKILFVHANQLQEQIGHNSYEKLNDEDTEVISKKSGMQLTALNDLIGKNPNVQLEGLKRLLGDNTSKNYNIPAIQGAEPFQTKDTTQTEEKTIDIHNSQGPNIQINSGDNTITLQTSHPVDKGSLEDIQKQLDEASKIQAQQVLARAQQAAQAHVEAQHKAIALAQVEAQKAALENIKNSIYGHPEALPLIRSNEQVESNEDEHTVTVNNLTPTQSQPPPQISVLPIITNHAITSHSSAIQPVKTDQPQNSALSGISLKQFIPQSGPEFHASTPSRHATRVPLYQKVAPQSYGSKELLYYAPHHHHQTIAQHQANNALLAQIKERNKALLHNHKNAPSAIQQILKTEQVSGTEVEDATNIHAVTHEEPQATAYQHIVLESKEIEDTADEEKDYDDLDDLQYAAKYAFGYRIKDTKEGNDFGHEERRNGKSLEGSYHVLLPDGRLQKVEYYADKSGYHAKVTYEHLDH